MMIRLARNELFKMLRLRKMGIFMFKIGRAHV